MRRGDAETRSKRRSKLQNRVSDLDAEARRGRRGARREETSGRGVNDGARTGLRVRTRDAETQEMRRKRRSKLQNGVLDLDAEARGAKKRAKGRQRRRTHRLRVRTRDAETQEMRRKRRSKLQNGVSDLDAEARGTKKRAKGRQRRRTHRPAGPNTRRGDAETRRKRRSQLQNQVLDLTGDARGRRQPCGTNRFGSSVSGLPQRLRAFASGARRVFPLSAILITRSSRIYN